MEEIDFNQFDSPNMKIEIIKIIFTKQANGRDNLRHLP